MNRLLAITAGVLIFATGISEASVAPANPADVPPTAKWWIHIDFDAARETNFGKYLHEKAVKDPHVEKILTKLKDEWGLDLHKDLHGATLYSSSYIPHTGVLIAYVEAEDGQKFMTELRKKPDFLELKTADGKYTLYSWTEKMHHHFGPPMKKPGEAKDEHGERPEPKKPDEHEFHARMLHEMHELEHPRPQSVWAAFPTHGVAIFSDSASDLVAALSHAENTSEKSEGGAPGVVISGALCDINTLPLPPHMRLAKKIMSIAFQSGEKDGKDFDHVEVNLIDAAVAGQLKSIIVGLQAMGQIHCADHAEMLKMIDGLKAEASGTVLTIDWQASSDDVIKFADKVCEFIHKHHAEEHK